MLPQRPFQHIAVAVIVVQGFDLGHAAQQIEGFVVEFVDVGQMRVGHDDVRKPLHVSNSVGNPVTAAAAADQQRGQLESHIRQRGVCRPCWELGPHIVCGADQATLCEGAAKEGQLAEANWPHVALDPSAEGGLQLSVSYECFSFLFFSMVNGQRGCGRGGRTHPEQKLGATRAAPCWTLPDSAETTGGSPTGAVSSSRGEGVWHASSSAVPAPVAVEGRKRAVLLTQGKGSFLCEKPSPQLPIGTYVVCCDAAMASSSEVVVLSIWYLPFPREHAL